MDDATKSAALAASRVKESPDTQREEDESSFVAYMDDSTGRPDSSDSGLTTTAKALDRWFKERQAGHAAPRLLEVPNEAMVTNGGPIQITGNITLIKEDGSIQYANHLTLCRCGHSSDKPTCDESHLDVEFLHSGKISEISEVAATQRASKITISCIKDGPITFRGKLKLHNEFGQECVKMRGSICRCGQSASKPFCDGSHNRTGFRTG